MTAGLLPERRFPERSFYRVGETGKLAQATLARWVNGGSLFPDIIPLWWPERDLRDQFPAKLEFRGELREGGGMRWSVSYRRVGDPRSCGMSSGYSSAEDAAYAALTLVEEDELERYEADLVVGVA